MVLLPYTQRTTTERPGGRGGGRGGREGGFSGQGGPGGRRPRDEERPSAEAGASGPSEAGEAGSSGPSEAGEALPVEESTGTDQPEVDVPAAVEEVVVEAGPGPEGEEV
jgi:hypothetical protein